MMSGPRRGSVAPLLCSVLAVPGILRLLHQEAFGS